jgi:hypothetical protein
MVKMEQSLFMIGGTLTRTKKIITGKRGTMLSQGFSHRHNVDETHDSICMACFVTIATVGSETELVRYELLHICNPVNRYRIDQGCDLPPENSTS